MAVLSVRVFWWLPIGFSADGSNSFSPLMPQITGLSQSAQPWNPLLENGYPNPQIPRFLESLPTYALSSLHLSTWSAQATWLFVLYFVGAVLAILAAAELFPSLRDRWWALTLVGVLYQLTPSLMFGLQDTAAFGLQIAVYWGIPLLAFLVLRAERSDSPIIPLGVGAVALLAMTEFPATLVPTLAFATFLGILTIVRRWNHRELRRLPRFVCWSALWTSLFNAWWLVPEYQYRDRLISNLSTSTPNATAQPDHLSHLIFLNWSWPDASGFLSYLNTWPALVGSCAILIITIFSVFEHKRAVGSLTIFVAWLTTFLLVYGFASPFNSVYHALFQLTIFSYLIRNPGHFSGVFNFLLSVLFAVGAVWFVERLVLILPRSARFGRLVARSVRRAQIDRGAEPALITNRVRGVIAVCCLSGLIVMASWPLVNGDALENVTFTGQEILPVSPFQKGVVVPGYYYDARNWLAADFPNAPTMVLPMPDTWLSAASHLSWGYEGSSAIYETLLSEPLISNNAGTLTSPTFPAVQEAYSIAAAGGPPGSRTALEMNSSTYIWPGFTQDSLTFVQKQGVNLGAGYNWSVYLGRNYGTNGHQFTWYLKGTLPSNASYFGMWIRPEVAGSLLLTWNILKTVVGWYRLSAAIDQWNYVVIPMVTPPEVNYEPGLLNVSEFPNATAFTFQIQPTAPISNASGLVQVADFSTYAADSAGVGYYVASLGARTVVVDTSIAATFSDPLQNLTTFRKTVAIMNGWQSVHFGNVTIYEVPSGQPPVVSVDHWTNASTPLLAWSERTTPQPFFAVSPPATVPTSASLANISIVSRSAATIQMRVQSRGPIVVTLLQNYDPLWIALVGSQQVGVHFIMNGFANAWFINRAGEFDLTLEFSPIQTMETLAVVSSAIGAILMIYLLPGSRSFILKATLRAGRNFHSWLRKLRG